MPLNIVVDIEVIQKEGQILNYVYNFIIKRKETFLHKNKN